MNNETIKFNPGLHIVNLLDSPEESMSNGAGDFFEGITGVPGASAVLHNGESIGVDRIMMRGGTAFSLHTHPGSHILVIARGGGVISVDGVDYDVRAADSIYIPAVYPHAVRAGQSGLTIIAFGYPHESPSSERRMTLVNDDRNSNWAIDE